MMMKRRARIAVPAPGRRDYVKVGDGFIAVTHYKDGDTVRLHPAQAKYPLMQGIIAEPKAASAPAPRAPRKSAQAG